MSNAWTFDRQKHTDKFVSLSIVVYGCLCNCLSLSVCLLLFVYVSSCYCLCVWLSVCLSVSVFVFVNVYRLLVCLTVRQTDNYVSLYIPFLCLSMCLFVFVCEPVCLFVCEPVCLFICEPVCLFVFVNVFQLLVCLTG